MDDRTPDLYQCRPVWLAGSEWNGHHTAKFSRCHSLGADYAPLTYLAEPIRLFSSMFSFWLNSPDVEYVGTVYFGSVAEQILAGSILQVFIFVPA